MSRNRRRQGYRSGFPWPIVIFGAILLIVAAFLLVNRSGGSPAIAVDQQKIDYGYVQFGGERSFTIKVTNTGDGVLRLREKPYIQVLEGC